MHPKSDEEFLEILASWEGTPFHRFTAMKGRGVDCIQFAHAVYVEAGWIEPATFPKYNIKGQGKKNLDILCDNIESQADVVRVVDHDHFNGMTYEEGINFNWKVGDVVIMSRGLNFHHSALIGGRRELWQALIRGGVSKGELFDPNWLRHFYRVYRLRSRNEE